MIKITQKGDFRKTKRFLKYAINADYKNILKKYGEKGLIELAAATPFDSGETANSWSYTIEVSNGNYSIVWSNGNLNDGVNIAILLQYGHATGTGGYVVGRDYINPALRPVFDEMATNLWEELINK